MIHRQTISLADLFSKHYRPRRLLGRSPTTVLQYGIQIRHLARHLGREPTLDGRSARQIAELIDLDYRQIARFLRDERTLSQGAIDRLAKALGLDLRRVSRRDSRASSAREQDQPQT